MMSCKTSQGPANAVTRRRDGLLSAVMLGRSGREQHVVAYIRISASVAIPEEGASQEQASLRPDEQDLSFSPFFLLSTELKRYTLSTSH